MYYYWIGNSFSFDLTSIILSSSSLPVSGPSCLSHLVPCWTLCFGLLIGDPARCSPAGGGWGNCADSTRWSSCKSLFYGPYNDPPGSNLQSVALQIEAGSQRGWLGRGGCGGVPRLASRGAGGLENTHYDHTHTRPNRHIKTHFHSSSTVMLTSRAKVTESRRRLASTAPPVGEVQLRPAAHGQRVFCLRP